LSRNSTIYPSPGSPLNSMISTTRRDSNPFRFAMNIRWTELMSYCHHPLITHPTNQHLTPHEPYHLPTSISIIQPYWIKNKSIFLVPDKPTNPNEIVQQDWYHTPIFSHRLNHSQETWNMSTDILARKYYIIKSNYFLVWRLINHTKMSANHCN
jgi:hypothetical protein